MKRNKSTLAVPKYISPNFEIVDLAISDMTGPGARCPWLSQVKVAPGRVRLGQEIFTFVS
jgi:hypothetical protein